MDDKLLSNLSLSNSLRPQEKVESIEQIIYLLNKYIRDPESLNEVFTTDLTKAVSLILQHPIITGQRGDELASDLIFRVIKLFFNICEKNYENRSEISKDFFALIRNIFDEYYHHNFFVTKEQDKDLVKGTHKDLNYTDYNKFFQNDFEIKEASSRASKVTFSPCCLMLSSIALSIWFLCLSFVICHCHK